MYFKLKLSQTSVHNLTSREHNMQKCSGRHSNINHSSTLCRTMFFNESTATANGDTSLCKHTSAVKKEEELRQQLWSVPGVLYTVLVTFSSNSNVDASILVLFQRNTDFYCIKYFSTFEWNMKVFFSTRTIGVCNGIRFLCNAVFFCGVVHSVIGTRWFVVTPQTNDVQVKDQVWNCQQF